MCGQRYSARERSRLYRRRDEKAKEDSESGEYAPVEREIEAFEGGDNDHRARRDGHNPETLAGRSSDAQDGRRHRVIERDSLVQPRLKTIGQMGRGHAPSSTLLLC